MRLVGVLLTYMCWKVCSEARMEPPLHADACAQKHGDLGVSGELPLHPTGKAWVQAVPPDRLGWYACRVLWTVNILLHRGLQVVSWMLQDPTPRKEGRKAERSQGSRATYCQCRGLNQAHSSSLGRSWRLLAMARAKSKAKV